MAWKVEIRSRRREADALGAAEIGCDTSCELDCLLVEIGKEVRSPADLLRHRFLDLGMGVADEHGAGAKNVVDILVARRIPKSGTVAPRKNEARVSRQRVAPERAAREQLLGRIKLRAFARRNPTVSTERGVCGGGVQGCAHGDSPVGDAGEQFRLLYPIAQEEGLHLVALTREPALHKSPEAIRRAWPQRAAAARTATQPPGFHRVDGACRGATQKIPTGTAAAVAPCRR